MGCVRQYIVLSVKHNNLRHADSNHNKQLLLQQRQVFLKSTCILKSVRGVLNLWSRIEPLVGIARIVQVKAFRVTLYLSRVSQLSILYPIIIQVSTNGLLSFEEGFDSYIVSRFPRTAPSSVPLIAPLWADFNFRDAGTLYYRVTTEARTLDAAVEYIEYRNAIYGEYRPTMAVVVTWFQSKVLRIEEMVNYCRALNY